MADTGLNDDPTNYLVSKKIRWRANSHDGVAK